MPLLISTSNNFSLKVVIITGGSSGIGLAMARQFSERGATVVIGDLNEPSTLPQECTFLKTDVTSWQSQLALFQRALQLHDRIDIVCANAGVGEGKDFEDIVNSTGDPVEPKWTPITVNLVGMANTTKLAIHYLKKSGRGGQIILTSSLSGYDSWGIPSYAASKHGVIGMMQGLRDLVPRHNITINALAPGFTETGMANDADMFEKLREAGVTVQGADDVALGALYFASNTSLNGETLAVIGGTYIELEKPMKSAFLGVIKDASSNSTRKAAGGDGAKLAQKYFDVPLL